MLRLKNVLTAASMAVGLLVTGAASAETLSGPLAGYYRANGQTVGGAASAGANHTTGSFGGNTARGYFIYSIPAGAPITGATLSVNAVQVLAGPNTLEIYDVTTSPATVASAATSVAVYNDLGTGTMYGTAVATVNNEILTIALNPDGIAAINAARGGSFAIGFLNATDGGGSDTIFLSSVNTVPRNLVLTRAEPVPTLSEWAMIILGLMLASGAAFYVQRRKFIA